MKWILVAPLLVAAGMAKAAPVNTDVDLNTFSSNPLQILGGLGPETLEKDKDKKDKDNKKEELKKKIPQSCIDAKFTDEQKAKTREAVYNSVREKVQLKANLKLAMMAYGHTVLDSASDLAAAQAASAEITTAVGKLVDNHMALGNEILYNIATPEQRPNTFACLLVLHKMGKNKKHKGLQ